MFPATDTSAIADLVNADPQRRARSLERIAIAYWKPVYAYARLKWRIAADAAEDLTQGFFAEALDRDAFAGFDPARSRFRTYLRACFDRFAIDRHRRETAQRRGGGSIALPLDFSGAEAELVAHSNTDPEAVFDAAWLRHLMQLAIDRLRAALADRKPIAFTLFERFHLTDDAPTYAAVAAELDIKLTDLTNWLALARREFRRIALGLLREITASDEEFADEARSAFGLEIQALDHYEP